MCGLAACQPGQPILRAALQPLSPELPSTPWCLQPSLRLNTPPLSPGWDSARGEVKLAQNASSRELLLSQAGTEHENINVNHQN